MSPRRGIAGLAVLALCSCGADEGSGRPASTAGPKSAPTSPMPEAPTWAEHVAPVLYEHCVVCHRPGEVAPFPLLSYDDARKHAKQIAQVTESRFMPPWLPEPGELAQLVGERRLDERELQILARWAATGASPGDPAIAPPPPAFTPGWQLGTPDLVLRTTEPYTVPADGLDVYRNFVIPVPLEQGRFVRAVELRPGNARVVHHAVLRVDPTDSSRRADAEDPGPGFDGMMFRGARMPGGHFLGWTPGRTPQPGSDDESWRLDPGTDLVLQVHMRPTGKPEPVQVELGLFFAQGPPQKPYLALLLSSRDLDIAAGEKDYRTTDSYVLPVDVFLLSIYPHAHYLGKRLEGWATFPDGRRISLIRISSWDFNWQDQYRYREPVFPPRGTRLEMDFSYDNSAENPFNPRQPPVRVKFGPQSTDEMSELIVEVTPRDRREVAALDADYRRKFMAMEIDWLERELAARPDDPAALGALGTRLHDAGEPARALELLTRAVERAPQDADLAVALGLSLSALGRHAEAATRYRRAVELAPDHPQAHGNLGNAYRELGRLELARDHLERALALEPRNGKTHNNAGVTYKALGNVDQAIAHFERAIALEPQTALFHSNLGNALRQAGRDAEAIAAYEAALERRPDWPTPLSHLAWIRATSRTAELRRPADALQLAMRATQLTQQKSPETLDTLAAALAATGRFDEAVAATDRAIELAERASLDDLARAMRARRSLYAAGEAYVGP